ncbi:tetratricopeptide repeat protein [candidate division WOR-3 bacterium]|nr:tetratricopeptide repeat protein [candidate division WOR-3 bacterium]
MKAFIIFLLLILNQNLPSKELSNNELFIKGNSLYREGNYEEAIDQYEKIIKNGLDNGFLFYNLGNAYFKKGKLGYAILYYEKAHNLFPRDREISENLHLVKSFTQDRIEEKKPPFLLFILYVLLNKFSFKELLIFVSIIFSFTFICSILFVLKKTLLLLKNLTISLFVILLLSCLLLSLKIKSVNVKRCIIIEDLINVTSAPSNDATREFVIHEGTEFQIIESINDWVKIRLKDGKSGWINSENIGKI